MDFSSPIFDKIRVSSFNKKEEGGGAETRRCCEHPTCTREGTHRAPVGRLQEGKYFHFCLDHVKEYNRSYNYFNGMSDHQVQNYQRESLLGHRPTWVMGLKRGMAFKDHAGEYDATLFGFFKTQIPRGIRPRGNVRENRSKFPVRTPVMVRALKILGLEAKASSQEIKSQYKQLVKRLHPDSNGGDRSSEEKLREIIAAYRQLRGLKIVI